MPKKRRNNGRSLSNKGRAIPIHCNNCTRLVPKDKAVKRYVIKNMVDGSSKRDIDLFRFMQKYLRRNSKIIF